MSKNILLLDLDGVLITTPGWKSDEIAPDGYSAFNTKAVSNLNDLLSSNQLDIWLISSRRKGISLEKMNTVFVNRGVNQAIKGYVPNYEEELNRRSEVERFVEFGAFENVLILDDDSSLRSLKIDLRKNWVEINALKGFNNDYLELALAICDNWKKIEF